MTLGRLLLLCTLALLTGLAFAGSPSLVLQDGGIEFPDGTVQATAAAGFPAPVQETGQVACYDASGTQIVCDGTGQDGDLRTGAKWPVPRFTDNDDGTVTDNLTGLVWLKDADCYGPSTELWETALTLAASLADGTCSLSDGSIAGDWRLPNVRELLSLINYAYEPPAAALPPNHPFTNLAGWYYSSTTTELNTNRPYSVNVSTAQVDSLFTKTDGSNVWPVRGGM